MKFSVLLLFFLVSCIPPKKTPGEEQNNNNNNQQSDDAECSAKTKKILEQPDTKEFLTQIEEIKKEASLLKNNSNHYDETNLNRMINNKIDTAKLHCNDECIAGLPDNEKCSHNNQKVDTKILKHYCDILKKIQRNGNKDNNIKLITDNFAE